MRLLNIHTLKLQEFEGDEIPPYIVTSHRWGKDEATYKDVLKDKNKHTVGYEKIKQFCKAAKSQYLQGVEPPEWLWIDTCCINKDSSAEVSESINSMFAWYRNAEYCLAYLRDVEPQIDGYARFLSDFRGSAWFRRGWTLQELLAPKAVLFFSTSWVHISYKISRQLKTAVKVGSLIHPSEVCNLLAAIMHVPQDVLMDSEHMHRYSREAKMGWMRNRQTTKAEDMAYCLLGIFDVSMPLIYGEGRSKAERRLHREIASTCQHHHMPVRFPIKDLHGNKNGTLSASTARFPVQTHSIPSILLTSARSGPIGIKKSKKYRSGDGWPAFLGDTGFLKRGQRAKKVSTGYADTAGSVFDSH